MPRLDWCSVPGTGIQKDGANYLVASDARIEVEEDLLLEGVEADQFLKTIERAGAPLNIVILDACRDNPLPKRSRSGARGFSTPVINWRQPGWSSVTSGAGATERAAKEYQLRSGGFSPAL